MHYGRRLLAEQPISSAGVWNQLEYRPLEGFVLAITPFNFTSIAGNLPTAPALLGNVVVWKPSPTQQLAAHQLMRLLEAAGLPPGVINLVTGSGEAVSRVALTHPDLAGIHFTGSTGTFQHLWRTVGENIARYRGYPRLVGETGGKDFVVAHPSADPAEVLTTALVRGAFEYQGQKCSAASRAYIPRSVWSRMRDDLIGNTEALTMGDVSTDLSLFMGAVIDSRAFAKHADAIGRARSRPGLSVLTGGATDDSTTPATSSSPRCWSPPTPPTRSSPAEYFGPILGVHVFEERRLRAGAGPGGRHRALRADRVDHRSGPGGHRPGQRGAALLGRELLHQRHAHWGDRRSAALRRRQGQRDQRQGRLDLQPDPLGERADDQGTACPTGGLPLSACRG